MSCSSRRAAKFLLIRVPTYRKGTTTTVIRIRPNGVWGAGPAELKINSSKYEKAKHGFRNRLDHQVEPANSPPIMAFSMERGHFSGTGGVVPSGQEANFSPPKEVPVPDGVGRAQSGSSVEPPDWTRNT